ncbi:hypothetical protein FS749_005901 [Ceratobasidium sp. UAMH 11750]|nr:hypothetical protein FS749_005901 [Ceratobasidium sp. UAMH 11750]
MFVTKLALAAVSALPAVYVAGAMPTGLMPRKDWKTALGWDGKVTTPVQLDQSNAVKPTPGKPAPAAVNGGTYFCTDINFTGRCAYVSGFGSGQCVNVGQDFNDNVSSFGPDPGLTCNIFRDFDCRGGITNPGFKNLADYSNDSMSSFSCSG